MSGSLSPSWVWAGAVRLDAMGESPGVARSSCFNFRLVMLACIMRFTEKFARRFVPAVLIGPFLVIVTLPLAFGWTWSESFYRGTSQSRRSSVLKHIRK